MIGQAVKKAQTRGRTLRWKALGRTRQPADGDALRVLFYHRVADDPRDPLAVSCDNFEAQMATLHAEGYKVVDVVTGLDLLYRGELEVAKAVDEAILEHTPPVQSRISWLWSLANIATLVGLIGTIVGLIGTFQALGNVPADQKQALLSQGISEAMNNTAFGLSIAVTCIVFHLFLSAYSKRMVESVELNALKLENLLARRASDSGATGEQQI